MTIAMQAASAPRLGWRGVEPEVEVANPLLGRPSVVDELNGSSLPEGRGRSDQGGDLVVWKDDGARFPYKRREVSKKRRLEGDQQRRRIRVNNFESQKLRSTVLDLNKPIDQGILGEGPASRAEGNLGLLDGYPPAQLMEPAMVAVMARGWPASYHQRDREVQEGHAPQFRGAKHGRSLWREHEVVGWPTPLHVSEKGLLGSGPFSGHSGAPENMFMIQAHHGSGAGLVNQELYSNIGLVGSHPTVHGILGEGPAAAQARDYGRLNGLHLRDQGLLGRWPTSAPASSEGTLHFPASKDQQRYKRRGDNAPDATLMVRSGGRYSSHEPNSYLAESEEVFSSAGVGRFVDRVPRGGVGVPELAFRPVNHGRFVEQELQRGRRGDAIELNPGRGRRYVDQGSHNTGAMAPMPTSRAQNTGRHYDRELSRKRTVDVPEYKMRGLLGREPP